jgi:hypothetical protein
MKKINVLGCMVLLFIGHLSLFSADKFYVKLISDVKVFYAKGEYSEVLANLEIAKFGLANHPDLMKEVYLYYALSYFKTKEYAKMMDAIKKLEADFAVSDLTNIPHPPAIAADIEAVQAVRSVPAQTISSQNIEKIRQYETLFQKTLIEIQSENLKKIKTNFKQLKSLLPEDMRNEFVQGILFYLEKNYKKSLPILADLEQKINRKSLTEYIYYFQALLYFENNQKNKAAEIYQKMEDDQLKAKLESIIFKVPAQNVSGAKTVQPPKNDPLQEPAIEKTPQKKNTPIQVAAKLPKEKPSKTENKQPDYQQTLTVLLKDHFSLNTPQLKIKINFQKSLEKKNEANKLLDAIIYFRQNKLKQTIALLNKVQINRLSSTAKEYLLYYRAASLLLSKNHIAALQDADSLTSDALIEQYQQLKASMKEKEEETLPKTYADSNDESRKSFNKEFITLYVSQSEDIDKLTLGIKRLEKMAYRDSRIDFLKAIANFKKKQYQECILAMKQVNTTELTSDQEEEYYFYIAASYILLEQPSKAQKYKNKMKSQKRIINLEAALKNHTKAAETSINVPQTKKTTDSENHQTPANSENSFSELFEAILTRIRTNLYLDFEKGLRKDISQLAAINKKDFRIDFLLGILQIKERKFSQAIDLLNKSLTYAAAELQNDIHYYLSIAHYFSQHFGLSLYHYKFISDPDLIEKQNFYIQKINKQRLADITNLVNHPQNRKLLKTILQKYDWDTELALEIINTHIRQYPQDNPVNFRLTMDILNSSEIYSAAFIQQAVNHSLSMKNYRDAVQIIERSVFIKSVTAETVSIHYQLAELYLQLQNPAKAKSVFLKINQFQKGYKDTEYFLNKLK